MNKSRTAQKETPEQFLPSGRQTKKNHQETKWRPSKEPPCSARQYMHYSFTVDREFKNLICQYFILN
jgi:hypothetical protein